MDILSQHLSSVVREIGAEVTPEDIDSYERYHRVKDSSYRLRTILDSWEKQQHQDRKTRGYYAVGVLFGMLFEVMLAALAFFFVGFKVINITQWEANVFIAGIFTQVVSLAVVVVRYLFPRPANELVNLIEKL